MLPLPSPSPARRERGPGGTGLIDWPHMEMTTMTTGPTWNRMRLAACALTVCALAALGLSAKAEASPPNWETVCASPGPALVMWAMPARYDTPENACITYSADGPCELRQPSDSVWFLSLTPERAPVLLIQHGPDWFSHQGLLAPDERIDAVSRHPLPGDKPKLERIDLRLTRTEGDTTFTRELTLLCGSPPSGGHLFCLDLPSGWSREGEGKGSTSLELHRCPSGDIALAGPIDHLSDETQRAITPLLGAHPLHFGLVHP